MYHRVDNQLVIRLYRAIGIPVMEAKRLLSNYSTDRQIEYVIAAENAENGILYDPIENDPTLGPIIKTAINSVAERVNREHTARISELEKTSPTVAELFRTGRGQYHRIWHETKKHLKHDFDIDWRTPAEMNPWIQFD